MSKLYFRYGAMGSGKSAALLQVAYNYNEKGMYVILMKPQIDTKAENKISSRIGIEREVDILIPRDSGIIELIPDTKKPHAIIVDESQFLTSDQVDELYFISKIYNIPVLCYGLRCDFQMKGFEGSTRLLEIADDIEEMKTICKCGNKATQNIRLVNGEPTFEGEQIIIDDHTKVEYEGVCGNCYLQLRRRK